MSRERLSSVVFSGKLKNLQGRLGGWPGRNAEANSNNGEKQIAIQFLGLTICVNNKRVYCYPYTDRMLEIGKFSLLTRVFIVYDGSEMLSSSNELQSCSVNNVHLTWTHLLHFESQSLRPKQSSVQNRCLDLPLASKKI